jgi:hypothetical protein
MMGMVASVTFDAHRKMCRSGIAPAPLLFAILISGYVFKADVMISAALLVRVVCAAF